MRRLITVVGVCSLLGVAARAQAQNLLTDGDFEFAAHIPDWDLVESIYDQTTMMDRGFGDINSAQQHTFGPPHSGTQALWLRAFVGGNTPNPNNLTNAVLSQTVPAVVGEQYTFTGWSLFEANYPGGLDTLPASSPLGAVPSPTTTTMRLEFLDSGGVVVGTPVVLDVKADREAQIGFPFSNDHMWYQHSLMGTALAGAESVRVTGEARKMVATQGNPDGGFYDDFALRAASASGTELLANPGLEITPSGSSFHPDWVVTQVPGGQFPANPTIQAREFASRPEGQGQLGAWLLGFTGNASQPADAILEQTVPGVPGTEYTFSGWSIFGTNYSGGLAGSDTQTFFEVDFLNADDEVIADETVTLDLKADRIAQSPTQNANDNVWYQHALTGTAPGGTASVLVRAAGLDTVFTMDPGQGAFWDDFALVATAPGLPGDYNDDGKVNAADYVVWRKNPSAHGGDPDGYNTWRGNFGAPGSSSGIAAGAVPEPSSAVLIVGIAFGLVGVGRRRRKHGSEN